jgi:hypothetical protein
MAHPGKSVGVPNHPTAAVHSINSDVRGRYTSLRESRAHHAPDYALQTSGLEHGLLLDNGLSYITAVVAPWLDGKTVTHGHGMPYQPMR